jgi:hypothetical protein
VIYEAYFAELETAAPMAGAGVTDANFRAQREERLKRAAELEKVATLSAMKAYFFIAAALQLREFRSSSRQWTASLLRIQKTSR